jgi:hypothetical protein
VGVTVPSDVDRLILNLIQTGRYPTGAELEAIRWHVAQSTFDRSMTLPADPRVVGLQRSDGTVVKLDDPIPTAELHYLRHIVRQAEWPIGTTQAQYEASLGQLASGLRVGVLLREVAHFGWHVTIVGRSGNLRGPRGSAWMIVEYRVSDGYWVTGYQPRDGLLFALRRARRRWLRLPT